ncbi:helix-turn-helix domain-containing protein [Pedobacter sp. GR22-10]|uniref:helix-turn-helix domain-containing protein n=1 Tax=Pedobacter sp. GR22-10 TaxID=2994472 RepID=UPI0022461754|nr:helix-turn-helix domain-containing protein [Pedobacter sp. GR22-10]MCX2429929.1 helix-turn-helix domain-containing protein [Pedobacter sp. GR22-10]
MDNVSFETLPKVVQEIRDKLIKIESLFQNLKSFPEAEDGFLNITEAAKFLELTESTLYGKVCRMEIPVNKKGKRLYFEKTVLKEWVLSGKRKTKDDISEMVRGNLKPGMRF